MPDHIQHIMEHPGFKEAIEAATEAAIRKADEAEEKVSELESEISDRDTCFEDQYDYIQDISKEIKRKEKEGKPLPTINEVVGDLVRFKGVRYGKDWDILSEVVALFDGLEPKIIRETVTVEKIIEVEKVPNDFKEKVQKVIEAAQNLLQ